MFIDFTDEVEEAEPVPDFELSPWQLRLGRSLARQSEWRFDGEWTSALPQWRARAAAELSEILSADGRPAETKNDVGDAQCAPSGVIRYGPEGIDAETVIADQSGTGSLHTTGETYIKEVDRVRLKFDRPHAVVAVARGGIWEGVRLFEAWVTPDTWA